MVAILSRSYCVENQEISLEDRFGEYVFVEIIMNKSDKVLVGLMYRSDSGSSDNDFELLNRIALIGSQNYSYLPIIRRFQTPEEKMGHATSW